MVQFFSVSFFLFVFSVASFPLKAVDYGKKNVAFAYMLLGVGNLFVKDGFDNPLDSQNALATGEIIAGDYNPVFGGPLSIEKYPSTWSMYSPIKLSNFSYSVVQFENHPVLDQGLAVKFKQKGIINHSSYLKLSASVKVYTKELLHAAGSGDHKIEVDFFYDVEQVEASPLVQVPNVKAMVDVFCPGGEFIRESTNDVTSKRLTATLRFNPSDCSGPLMVHASLFGSSMSWKGFRVHHTED